MNAPLSQREAIFRYAKIFIGQYLSSVHNFDSFQDEALNLLTVFLIQMIKSFALKVKGILNLQGRSLPNALHVLVVADQMGSYDFERILEYIQKKKETALDLKSIEIIQKLGKVLFQNDIETINNYPKETINPNIRFIPPVYLMDLTKKALPYRHPIDEVLPLPPEVTYQETKQRVVRERKNIEYLSSYTKRENRIATVGRMIDEEHNREKEKKGQEVVEGAQVQQIEGVVPQKKLKFDLISYL